MPGETLIELLAIIVATAALICSFLSYRQSHKINNENMLYQEKINAYKDIMYALSDLLNTMGLFLDLAYEKLEQKNLNKDDKNEIRGFIDEIDEKTNEFDNNIKSNAAIIPNKILNKLEDLAFDLFKVEPLIDIQKSDIQNYGRSLDTFFVQADKLINMFRRDLNTKALNQALFKRIKANNLDYSH